MTLLESLYGPSTSAVLHEGEVGQSFRTSVGVHQGCLLSPELFNLYLENIIQEALHNFNGTTSINGREISNLRSADDIDLIAGTEEELQELTTLERRARAYGMEISAEKSKIMVNSRIAPRSTILMNGERLEEVRSFKYLGSIMHLLCGRLHSGNTHTDKPGNISDSKTQEYMEQQQHQNSNKDTTL